jgi:uncharacterized protein (DUF4415 family)
LLERPDTREDYGESPSVGIGNIRGRVAAVAFAERGPDIIRIISLRRANENERRQYPQALQDELEACWFNVGSRDRLHRDARVRSRLLFARIRWPGKKKQITLRLDPDVLAFFCKRAKG